MIAIWRNKYIHQIYVYPGNEVTTLGSQSIHRRSEPEVATLSLLYLSLEFTVRGISVFATLFIVSLSSARAGHNGIEGTQVDRMDLLGAIGRGS